MTSQKTQRYLKSIMAFKKTRHSNISENTTFHTKKKGSSCLRLDSTLQIVHRKRDRERECIASFIKMVHEN